MIRSLYTGASGLKNHQNKMDVVGNNIANVNTVGYKSSRTTFADILSQNIKGASASNGGMGSTNPTQIGLGTNTASIDLIFKDGAPVTTGKNTDLCLSGDGLFVVRGGNQTYYTRDGAFDFDAAGNYVLPGSGHYVQGWMGKDGVIDTTSGIGDIKITKGQPLYNATDFISYVENLSADVPTVTAISVDVDEALTVSFGGKQFYVDGIPKDGKIWRLKNDVQLGATSAEIEDEDGNIATIVFSPAATFEIPKGHDVNSQTSGLTKGSVTLQYPLTVTIDGKKYTAIAMDKDLSGSNWSLKSGGAKAGSSTLTITNGTEDITFTLSAPLQETIGEVQVSKAVASPDKPVTITFSDGTTVVKTDGTYEVGTSLPISTTTTVYDNTGAAYTVPLYFIRETTGNSDGKWLVSVSPDTSVTKGQTVTAQVTDQNGKEVTVSFPVAEIQFDENGNLITNSDSDTTGILSLGGQNITVDFTQLTQYPSETTVSSTSNGGGTAGTLKDIQIDSSGIITGIYTNGTRRLEAQVALAHFSNSAGLLKAGTSLYQESANSGTPLTIKAGEFGTVLTPGALEMSNVGIANEFADMIITQRGFQSNAKTITVGDELIETAINMKR